MYSQQQRTRIHIDASRELNSFGNTVGSADPYMYGAGSGYRTEGDAGLSLVGARYYDPQVGRFITRDTDLSQKPYLYCEHDPVNNVDPSGHILWPGLAELGGSVGGVLGGATVITGIGGIMEDHSAPHTLTHQVGGALAGTGTVIIGVGLVAAGALATAPVVIVVGAIGGVCVIGYGVWHMANAIWGD